MEHGNMPTLNVLWHGIIKRFLFAALAVAALGGVILMTHSSPAAAYKGGSGAPPPRDCGDYYC
ncbi:MAG TPA: hypothetical protein VEK34_13600 [Methylocella sp.]|nr:hypothetical protein [Methylocella sp.]